MVTYYNDYEIHITPNFDIIAICLLLVCDIITMCYFIHKIKMFRMLLALTGGV